MTKNEDILCRKVDLNSLSSVREFCSNLSQEYNVIDTLVCNAGVWIPMEKKVKTEDGFEVNFGVNYLAHVLMIKLLLEGPIQVKKLN